MAEQKRETRIQRKEDSPHHVLEETGTAFDPSTQHLDLSKEEKRRTTALMMAIQAYQNIIIKDAEMYMAISRDQGREGAPKIKEATMNAMVEAALDFDYFISGKLQEALEEKKLARRSASEPSTPTPAADAPIDVEAIPE